MKASILLVDDEQNILRTVVIALGASGYAVTSFLHPLQALEAMRLPEPICDALLSNGGRYQPFLDLAVASEADDGEAIADQAAMLGLTADQFNRAQLQALTFADAMEL